MKFSKLTQRTAGDNVDAWSVHFDGLARREAGEDVIVLSIGEEIDESTPPAIVEAAIRSLRDGRHHYTPVDGNADLRRAVARHHAERTGQPVSAANCAIFAGAQNALFSLAQCLLESGDEVILSEPFYTTYPATFSASGATPVCVPTKPEDGFRIDADEIIAAITPRTRAVVLNSPNNPTGAVYTRAHYEALVRACVQREIWLINDDVYQALLPPANRERSNPFALPGAEKVCVSVSSLSKSHRMTGWRLGWVIAPETLIGHLYNLAFCMSYGLPAFIQDAALTALAEASAMAEDTREKLARRRRIVLQQLGELRGVRLFAEAAQSGMFVVFAVGDLPVSARQFARELLQRHGVALLPGDGFGASCADLLRLSLCVDERRLAEACRRIGEYVRSLHAAA